MVNGDMVMMTLLAIGKEITLASNINLIKLMDSEKLFPRLALMPDGWKKDDGPVLKNCLLKWIYCSTLSSVALVKEQQALYGCWIHVTHCFLLSAIMEQV